METEDRDPITAVTPSAPQQPPAQSPAQRRRITKKAAVRTALPSGDV
jgi:hypothetical protein